MFVKKNLGKFRKQNYAIKPTEKSNFASYCTSLIKSVYSTHAIAYYARLTSFW